MYEFGNKEDKKRFLKTKYGKKVNKMFRIAVIVSIVNILLVIVAYVVSLKNMIDTSSSEYNLLFNIALCIGSVSIVIACYFDGKRDGAFEQFKLLDKK